MLLSAQREYTRTTTFTRAPSLAQITVYLISLLELLAFYLIIQARISALSARISFLSVYSVLALAKIVLTGIVSGIDPSDRLMMLCRCKNRDQQVQAKLVQTKKQVKNYLFCRECVAFVKPDSKHCKKCERCVQIFDHHCIWLNNCIGSLNYRWFIALLWVVQAEMSAFMAGGAYLWWQGRYASDIIIGNDDGHYPIYEMILVWVMMVLVCIFWLLNLNLIILHMYLIHVGKTTYEWLFPSEMASRRLMATRMISSRQSRANQDEISGNNINPNANLNTNGNNGVIDQHISNGQGEVGQNIMDIEANNDGSYTISSNAIDHHHLQHTNDHNNQNNDHENGHEDQQDEEDNELPQHRDNTSPKHKYSVNRESMERRARIGHGSGTVPLPRLPTTANNNNRDTSSKNGNSNGSNYGYSNRILDFTSGGNRRNKVMPQLQLQLQQHENNVTEDNIANNEALSHEYNYHIHQIVSKSSEQNPSNNNSNQKQASRNKQPQQTQLVPMAWKKNTKTTKLTHSINQSHHNINRGILYQSAGVQGGPQQHNVGRGGRATAFNARTRSLHSIISMIDADGVVEPIFIRNRDATLNKQ